MTLRALGYRMYFKLKNAFSDWSFLNKFKRFDYFDLGNSFVLYYGIVFFLFPLLYLAGLRFHSVAGKVEDGGIFQEWLRNTLNGDVYRIERQKHLLRLLQ